MILGSPGGPPWEAQGSPFWVDLGLLFGVPFGTLFLAVLAPKRLSFSRPFSGHPRGPFFDNASNAGSISGGPFRTLWGFIFEIFEGPPRGSISNHFGVLFGGPFGEPFGGRFSDPFFNLPVDRGPPPGVDFRSLFGLLTGPSFGVDLGIHISTGGTYFGGPFWGRFWTSKIHPPTPESGLPPDKMSS